MAKAKTATIYGLLDPRTAKIRYVGKTNDLKRRLYQHIRGRTDQKMTPVRAWIKSLVGQGLEPRMVVIETCDAVEWEAKEMFWIKHFRDGGHEVLNLAEGGNQPHCSVEVRRENGRRSAAVRERGLWLLLRYWGAAIKDAEESGRPDRANRFRHLANVIRSSEGVVRHRLNEYGLLKMGLGRG